MPEQIKPVKYGVVNKRDATPDDLVESGIVRIVDYWNGLRRENSIPLWSDFDWMKLPLDLVPGIAVFDVIDKGADLRVRFWGTAAVEVFKFEPTGKLVSEIDHAGTMDSLLREASDMVRTMKLQTAVHTIVLKSDTEVEIPVVRLPFSDDGRTVSKIMTSENLPALITLRS